jgi:hypothetical protein
MTEEYQYIRKIITAKNNDNLAIFIGAGISKTSETSTFKLPEWKDIIKDLKREIKEKDGNDFLKIAQWYYNAVGEDNYYKKISEYFPSNIAPSRVHEQIFNINPHIIITTNWDTILENAIRKRGYVFDVISNDDELINSTFQHKLIKMHGDFRHRNIIFKEDDYLDYSNKFPLIENQIKGILSTHAILFLGYSYNDINLKFIIQWIQSHSTKIPDMYFVTLKKSENIKNYLANKGITAIFLKDINKSLIGMDDFNDASKKICTFLNKITNEDEHAATATLADTISFVLERLEALDDLKGILIDQIQDVLTNCGFEFDNDSKPILQFYNQLLTEPYNQIIRNIFMKFIDILIMVVKKKNPFLPSPQLIKIFEILNKSDIKGIMLSKDELSNKKREYIQISEFIPIQKNITLEQYYNFDFIGLITKTDDINELFIIAFRLYNLDKIEDAFKTIEKVLLLCAERNNYTQLFIAIFNRDILLKKLKFNLDTKDRYKDMENYNTDLYYTNFTKRLQSVTKPVYEFTNFSQIYKYLYNIRNDLEQIEDAVKTIKAGGIVFGSGVYKASAKHKNLVNFILKNNILIEDYTEYKKINKMFVEISLLRQTQKNVITLAKTEIYSCVKYIALEDLKILFNDYYDTNSEMKGKFNLEPELKEWLINTVFINITSLHLSTIDTSDFYSRYISKILFLLSLIKIGDSDISLVLNRVNDIILKKKNTTDIFEAVNLFLGIQYNLYDTKIDDNIIVRFIKTFINKIIIGHINGYEYLALTRNEIVNLYGYAIKQKISITDEGMVDDLLKKISTYHISSQMELIQNFVLKIYYISSEVIKEKIKKFILTINSNNEPELYKKIIYDLTLIIFQLNSISKDNIYEIEKFIEPYKEGSAFSSVLNTLDSQIDFLMNDRHIDGLDNISSIIKKIIKRYNEEKRISLI